MSFAAKRSLHSISILSSIALILQLISQSLCKRASRLSARAFLSDTLPPHIAQAMRKVPASMRSGMGVYSTPRSFLTPSMTIVALPAPRTFPPMRLMKFCKSTISGSFAALRMTVFPSALTEASMMFSVAPTLGQSSTISAPTVRPQVQSMYPPPSSMCTPSLRSPFRCRSMGRRPMSQPPG